MGVVEMDKMNEHKHGTRKKKSEISCVQYPWKSVFKTSVFEKVRVIMAHVLKLCIGVANIK